MEQLFFYVVIGMGVLAIIAVVYHIILTYSPSGLDDDFGCADIDERPFITLVRDGAYVTLVRDGDIRPRKLRDILDDFAVAMGMDDFYAMDELDRELTTALVFEALNPGLVAIEDIKIKGTLIV